MKATEKDYYEQQKALLPVGFAWGREQGGIFNKVLAGFSRIWAKLHNRTLDLVKESDPQTALETLSDWEESLGLPDECTVNTATTVQERRAAVVEKYTTKGNQTVQRFRELAENLGYDVDIKEHRPFICGRSRCGEFGDILNGGHDVRFIWTVTPHGARLTRFRCGVSSPPERLCKFTRAADLECKLRRSSYAHTLPILNYEEVKR